MWAHGKLLVKVEGNMVRLSVLSNMVALSKWTIDLPIVIKEFHPFF